MLFRSTGPLAVSSANLSGRPAALTCDDAVDQLGDRVAVYLDGGPAGTEVDGARVSPPSTIVDFTRYDDGQVLRRGALDLETLRATVPGLRDLDQPEPAPEPEPEAAPEPEPEPQPDESQPDEPQPDEPQPDEPRVEPEPGPGPDEPEKPAPR